MTTMAYVLKENPEPGGLSRRLRGRLDFDLDSGEKTRR
jgi:hypothetical protein